MKNTRHIMARIESHFDSMTDLEKRIANYFLNPSSIYDDLSSQKVAQTLYISQAALTRFVQSKAITSISRAASSSISRIVAVINGS